MPSLAACENALCENDCEERCYTRCYACGMPACRPCSVIVTSYYNRGRRRVCTGCLEDRRDDVRSGNIVLPKSALARF
jgi:hypothetical protein